MCFEVTDRTLYTAEEDIPVHKRFDLKLFGMFYRSPHMGSWYFRWKPKKALIGNIRGYGFIDEGLHSYHYDEENDRIYPGSYVKMYIPKGATYYKNDREYVSSALKF